MQELSYGYNPLSKISKRLTFSIHLIYKMFVFSLKYIWFLHFCTQIWLSPVHSTEKVAWMLVCSPPFTTGPSISISLCMESIIYKSHFGNLPAPQCINAFAYGMSLRDSSAPVKGLQAANVIPTTIAIMCQLYIKVYF